MKAIVLALSLSFLILPLSAYSLENNMYFSVDPYTEYICVYVNLPQDLGLASVENNVESIIEAEADESPWIDTTYNKVVINPGVLNKNPVCFYHAGKGEGDFSFYKLNIYSPDAGVSNEMSGGLCISEYGDVDSGLNASKTTDICELLNDNADLFDLQFKHKTTFANPGETLTKTMYLTSYAKLNVDLALITTLQNDFGSQTVSTSPEHPLVSKNFKIKAPNKEGEYSVIILARVRGCGLSLCEKEVEGRIRVQEGYTKSGFETTVIPKNINIKEAKETIYRLMITNHDETKEFSIETSSDPSVKIDPKSITTMVSRDEEKTLTFKITPSSSGPELYRIYFKVKTSDSEKMVNAYLTVGELLTDAFRESTELEGKTKDPNIKDAIKLATNRFAEAYNTTSYGDDIDDYKDFKDEMEKAKKSLEEGNGGNGKIQPPEAGQGIDWIWFAIPVIIIALLLLFFIYKKSKVVSEFEYPRFE